MRAPRPSREISSASVSAAVFLATGAAPIRLDAQCAHIIRSRRGHTGHGLLVSVLLEYGCRPDVRPECLADFRAQRRNGQFLCFCISIPFAG